MARFFLSLCTLFLTVSHHPWATAADIPIDMILIPPGEFTMGSPEGSDGFPDERPERRVYISGYFMDRFEVTNHAYAAFVQATGPLSGRPIAPSRASNIIPSSM
jgi:formylglycine-generating enzyme required for sulfatase activity